jgi:drug/metabolite transporter (DMT)-like permease
MGVVSPIASLGVIVPVLGGLFQGDRPSAWQWAGMGLAFGGALAASGPELRGAVGRRSVALAVLAGLGFGCALLCLARGAAVNTLMTGFGMRATSVTGFALAGLIRRTPGGVGPRDLPILAVVGLADGGANLLFGAASRGEMLTVVSVLGALYPVATVVLARVILHERLLPVQRYGVAGALTGVALLAAG